MTFKESVRTVLKEKYLTIEGRAPRSEYWWFFLFYVLVNFAIGPVDRILFGANEFGPIGTLFGVLMVIPFITAGARRLHDRDMSAWWMLLLVIPLIGSIALIILYVLPGTNGPNRFGADPLGNDSNGPNDDDDDITLSQSSIPRVDRE
ncbi:MAG: DUF805 domain-containing protein [Boseongicola sp.]|jgi:uncharacterized membrane protein YhaH (DUF805 family)|nr:DUF805 domain-containing protein [Boseongicola sp.]